VHNVHVGGTGRRGIDRAERTAVFPHHHH